jgi:hypothetical protein
MARPVILATWEAQIGRIAFLGQPRQKVHMTPISTNSKASWYTPVMPITWKAEMGRNRVPGQPRVSGGVRKILSQQKRLGVVANACHPS